MIRRLFQKNILLLFFCTVPFFLIAEKPLLLGIAGGSGSGKTFLSNEIQDILQEKVLVLGQDSYYKDLSNTEDAKRAAKKQALHLPHEGRGETKNLQSSTYP